MRKYSCVAYVKQQLYHFTVSVVEAFASWCCFFLVARRSIRKRALSSIWGLVTFKVVINNMVKVVAAVPLQEKFDHGKITRFFEHGPYQPFLC
jgi:hypothetical protein